MAWNKVAYEFHISHLEKLICQYFMSYNFFSNDISFIWKILKVNKKEENGNKVLANKMRKRGVWELGGTGKQKNQAILCTGTDLQWWMWILCISNVTINNPKIIIITMTIIKFIISIHLNNHWHWTVIFKIHYLRVRSK